MVLIMQVSGLEIVVGRSLTREADGCTDNGLCAEYGYRCEPELFFAKGFNHYQLDISATFISPVILWATLSIDLIFPILTSIAFARRYQVVRILLWPAGIGTPFKLGGLDTAAR
jgi:hypothetical protein